MRRVRTCHHRVWFAGLALSRRLDRRWCQGHEESKEGSCRCCHRMVGRWVGKCLQSGACTRRTPLERRVWLNHQQLLTYVTRRDEGPWHSWSPIGRWKELSLGFGLERDCNTDGVWQLRSVLVARSEYNGAHSTPVAWTQPLKAWCSPPLGTSMSPSFNYKLI